MPTRYRQVAIAADVDSLEADALVKRFEGREAYMRTRFIVGRQGERCALVEVLRGESPELFSRIEKARVLAGPEACVYIHDSAIDTGVPSQMAAAAMRHPDMACVIVEGAYSHVSFLLNPKPLRLSVLDIVPPYPSKLLDQVQRVLDLAEDLPPIVAVPELIDSVEVLRDAVPDRPDRLLVPCRGSGIAIEGATISYLDERPAAADWLLLGCERSQQIHRWFYGRRARLVDTCPTAFLSARSSAHPPLTRCCLYQEGVEVRPQAVYVPWGASLAEVRAAIEDILRKEDVAWTRT